MASFYVNAKDYSFSFSDNSEWRSWGWHRATELFEAINNILVAVGKKPMTTTEIEKEFSHLSPMGHETFGTKTPYLSISGNTTWITTSSHWLGCAVEDDCYIPAKVGMAIIKAIKHPVFNKVNRLLFDKT